MELESITDENYEEFKNSSRAVLLISASWCQQCREYLPTIETMAKHLDFIRFGKAVLDEGKSIQLKKEYRDISRWLLPSTIFFREQKDVGKIEGKIVYSELFSKIRKDLIVGTTVFFKDANGIYIPASVLQMAKPKGPYVIICEEDSSLGKKGIPIHIPEDYEIKWNLEEKVK